MAGLHEVKVVILCVIINVVIQPSSAATLAHVDTLLGCMSEEE
jgi:hypothetical protein